MQNVTNTENDSDDEDDEDFDIEKVKAKKGKHQGMCVFIVSKNKNLLLCSTVFVLYDKLLL